MVVRSTSMALTGGPQYHDQYRRAASGDIAVVAGDPRRARGGRGGIFFVASPHESLSTFAVIAGIFLLFDGALVIAASIFGHGEGRGLLAVIGVLSAIAGLILIKHPFDTLIVFTMIVGIWFVVAGIVRFVVALSSPDGRGGNIALAIVDVVAGVVILAWPDLGLSTLAVIIGIVLILRGLLLIAAGWTMRGSTRSLLPERRRQARGSRSIAQIGGDAPNWISSTISNPCRAYRARLRSLVASR